MNPLLKKWLLVISLVVWASVSSIAIASLLLEHNLSFRPMKFLKQKNSTGWTMTHVLGSDCKCSEFVAQHLAKRGVQPGVLENVIILGHSVTLQKTLHDFHVTEKSPKELKGYVEGVPFLVIYNQNGDVVYTGGYSSQHIYQDTALLDIEILKSLQGKGPTPSSLPIFGCATSQKYQKLLDPFGLKYRSSRDAELSPAIQ